MARKILLSEVEIQNICKKIATQINEDYKNSQTIPCVVGVLKGSLPFMMDLIKYINIPITLDFIQVSSYEGKNSTGIITLKKDLSQNIEGRDIIIVEDVIDTGLTMSYLLDYIESNHKPKSIKVCSLFDKDFMRRDDVKLHIDYIGHKLTENQFLMGYGLDFNEIFREVPYVYIPDEEEIKYMEELSSKL